MQTILTERYRRWFLYEKEMHEKVLNSFQTVSSEERTSPLFQKAIDLFAHLATARLMWLYRFGVRPEAIGDLFPTNLSLAMLAPLLAEMHAAWEAYLTGLDDAKLMCNFVYRSVDGGQFSNSIDEILTQLFGHSWYHRGQIASLLKSLGGTPAITDFVYWTRIPLTDDTPSKDHL